MKGVCSILLTAVDSTTVGTESTQSNGEAGPSDLTGDTGLTGATNIMCGGVGEVCCASSTCRSGAICSGVSCVACGGIGQPCCAENACNAGARCDESSCVSCGAPGQICCDHGAPCEHLTCTGAGLCPPIGALVQVTHPRGGTYGIDKYEVTRAEYTAWLATTPSLTDQPVECDANRAPDSYQPGPATPCVSSAAACSGDRCPQTCVDWCDAHAYCLGVGKRLCGSFDGENGVSADVGDKNKQQWFNACSNGGTTPYATGNTAGSCRVGGFGSALPVGVAGCESSVAGYQGVFDLNGNVFEWTDLCVNTVDCYALGGNFAEDPPYETCAAPPNLKSRMGRFSGIGFRCCAR